LTTRGIVNLIGERYIRRRAITQGRVIMRRSIFIVVVLLLGLVSAGLVAPTARADRSYTDAISGTESSTGTIVGDTRTGVTFSGTATGELPGQWSVTLSYTPASPACGGRNRIIGGTWTFTGTDGTMLTGTVGRGSVSFDQYCAFGQVEAQLRITSCAGSTRCAGFNGGRGQFDGTLNHLPILFGQPATITGTLQLRF